MKLKKQPFPIFIMGDEHFDAMQNASQIAVCAYIARNYRGGSLSFKDSRKFCKEMGISDADFLIAFSILIQMGAICQDAN